MRGKDMTLTTNMLTFDVANSIAITSMAEHW